MVVYIRSKFADYSASLADFRAGRGSNRHLLEPTKPQQRSTVVGFGDLMTWLKWWCKKKFLINQFSNIKYRTNVKLIRNIFSVSLKSWGILNHVPVGVNIVYAYFFVYVYVVYALFLLFIFGKNFVLNVRRNFRTLVN